MVLAAFFVDKTTMKHCQRFAELRVADAKESAGKAASVESSRSEATDERRALLCLFKLNKSMDVRRRKKSLLQDQLFYLILRF